MRKPFFAGNLKNSNRYTNNYRDNDSDNNSTHRAFLRNSGPDSLITIPKKQLSSFQGSISSNSNKSVLTKSLGNQINDNYNNFYQLQLNKYIINFQIYSEYQKIHLDFMAEELSKLDIFNIDDNKKSLDLILMCNLIWSPNTQKACIECMNNGSWIVNLNLIEKEINSLLINRYQLAYLTFILKFVGQFTTNFIVYNACILVVSKLADSKNIIHMITFNKTFRPKYTLFPEKNTDLNRIACFNPCPFGTSDITNIKFYRQRIIFVYKLISENNYCNNALLKARQIYLLNSLIEYNKLTKEVNENINITDLFDTLIYICKDMNIFDQSIYEKNSKSIMNVIKSIRTSPNTITAVMTEEDILQKNKIDPDLSMIDLLDLDMVNGDNNAEIIHILEEVSMNISDEIYNAYTSKFSKCAISKQNKELIEVFLFIMENNMVNKNNYAYLNMLAKINQNEWILNNFLDKK